MKLRLAVLLVAAVVTAASAQNYRCDWSVNAIGGNAMSSTSYQCGATAGQTAAGKLESSSFLALIGYWQGDVQVGVREPALPGSTPSATRLGAPAPNPFSSRTSIRYTLGSHADVRLAVYDRLGRQVRTLVDASRPPGSRC